MSDFFGDDFTADLRAYFLEKFVLEIEDSIDLIDDSIWMRIRSETTKQAAQVWAVDAKTNEFVYLAAWLEKFEEETKVFRNALEFKKYLEALRGYVKALSVEKVDSFELAAKFSSLGQSRRDSLFLHCRFGSQDFAIPLLNVVEISGSRPLFSLPDRKKGLLGVIPFRGDAVPVISFADHGFAPVNKDDLYYVVCEFDSMRFSLQVTETEDLLKIDESELQSVESHSTIIQTSFIKHFYLKNSRSVMVLDLGKLVA